MRITKHKIHEWPAIIPTSLVIVAYVKPITENIISLTLLPQEQAATWLVYFMLLIPHIPQILLKAVRHVNKGRIPADSVTFYPFVKMDF